MDRTVRRHTIGFAIVTAVALVLHYLILPAIGIGLLARMRGDLLYYLALVAALVPLVMWMVPPFSGVLARGTFEFHRRLFGRGGTYVRLPTGRKVRFTDTALLALGAFAIDLFVSAQFQYLLGPRAASTRAGFAAFSFVLVFVGLLTSLLPGPWLLEALELRLIVPSRGQVVRPSDVFERTIGPAGAAFLLASYVALLHTSQNVEYDRALFELGLWAVRLFPAVLGAVCVYRLWVEPRVLPRLRAWCAKEGIATRADLPQGLERLLQSSPGTRGSSTAEDPPVPLTGDIDR